MELDESPARPDWVSDDMFPLQSRFYTTPSGHDMHFIDEGAGKPIVFVHGNPTWSFEFRHLIQGLKSEFRCVAPDHIGFGLSSRSNNPDDHRPEAHAEAFSSLLDHLDLRDITLFLTDWGGPIGLNFARKCPDRVAGIVIANTWCWPVNRDFHFVVFSFMMSNRLGQYFIRHFNSFVNEVMPHAFGKKGILTTEVMEHYRNAQPSPDARSACAALPRAIVGSTDWLQSIWDDRAAFTKKPALILWGLKDIAFRKKELERWKAELLDFQAHEFKDCGHFLAEEAPDEILPLMHSFISQS